MKIKCDVCSRVVDSYEEWVSIVPFNWYIPLFVNDKYLESGGDGFLSMDTECEVQIEQFKLKDSNGDTIGVELGDGYLSDKALELYEKEYGGG